MSTTITLREVQVGYGALVVLAGVNLVVADGDRVGVVAPNGVGKSTLLRVLAGELVPESGAVDRAPRSATVVRLAQEPESPGDFSLTAYLGRRTGVTAAQAALDAAAADLAAGIQGAEARYPAALDRWLAVGGADLAERAAEVTARLGLPADLLGQMNAGSAAAGSAVGGSVPPGAGALSGGQRARLALAAVMLARPDILLLDEPTNDLDDDGLALLEEHVRSTPAGVVVVSHDRAFLSATVDRIVELAEFTRRVSEYRGGWDAYVAERTATRRHAVQAREGYETERSKLVEAARRQREWARSGAQRAANPRYAPDNDRNIRAGRIEGAQRLAAGATRAVRAVERLDAAAPADVREPWRLRLTIAEAPRSGDVVVELRDAVVTRGDVRLGPLDLSLGWAHRVRLVGPNGSGKTTLVDALTGRLPLTAGSRYAGPSVIFGELDQSRRAFDTDEAVAEVVRGLGQLPDAAQTRTLLAKFRLAGDTALRAARTLSPGERTRAALALLQARGVNCLVLDEPTNHLDIEAIEQLESALDDFGGTLILVTHDRRLADAVRVDETIDVRSLAG
jgi:ATPase subunit of ABC transporter with duplicated ATPase domains